MSAADPVRGKQGPHRARENAYPRKAWCECTNGRGEPAPATQVDGDCAKCGYPVREGRWAR